MSGIPPEPLHERDPRNHPERYPRFEGEVCCRGAERHLHECTAAVVSSPGMPAGPRIALTETLVAVDALGPSLAYLAVYNPTAAAAYLNRWYTDSGSTAGLDATNRAGGPWAVGPGATVVVPMDMPTVGRRAVALSASTGTDITGAPSAALSVVPHWSE